jgi:hypothetical protein
MISFVRNFESGNELFYCLIAYGVYNLSRLNFVLEMSVQCLFHMIVCDGQWIHMNMSDNNAQIA